MNQGTTGSEPEIRDVPLCFALLPSHPSISLRKRLIEKHAQVTIPFGAS